MLSFQDNHTHAQGKKWDIFKKISQLMFIKECYQSWDQFFFYTTYLKINTLGILVLTSMLSYSCCSIFKDRILMNRDFFKLKYSIPVKINLLLITSTLQLPWVFKTEFLLTILIQYKQTSDENKENINEGILNWSNTKFSKITVWQTVRKITHEILRVKGLTF